MITYQVEKVISFLVLDGTIFKGLYQVWGGSQLGIGLLKSILVSLHMKFELNLPKAVVLKKRFSNVDEPMTGQNRWYTINSLEFYRLR